MGAGMNRDKVEKTITATASHVLQFLSLYPGAEHKRGCYEGAIISAVIMAMGQADCREDQEWATRFANEVVELIDGRVTELKRTQGK